MAFGFLLGLSLGLGKIEAVFLGAVTAISSTMVAISLIGEKGQLGSQYGRIAIGILIVQALGAILMTVFLPTNAGNTGLWPALPLALAKGIGLVATTYILGTRVVPWLLQKVAAAHSRELFLLSIVSLALGTAIGGVVLGLSLAFGAFIAGLVVSESEFGHQTLAEILPLRDIFATVFFVAMGVLIDPAFILQHPAEVTSVVLFAVVAKFLLVTTLTVALGYPPRAALGAGLSLAQMGEFSFVLVAVGLSEQLMSEATGDLALSAVLLSIVLSPFLLALHKRLVQTLEQLPLLGALAERAAVTLELEQASPKGHAIVCGYGGTGREIANALVSHGVPFVVVERDPAVFSEVKREGLAAVYGDAISPSVLERAGVRQANLLAVAIPDAVVTEAAIANAKRFNANIDVIARSGGLESQVALRQAGASEVVYPQFEAWLEFVRHILRRFGVADPTIYDFVDARRLKSGAASSLGE